MIQYLLSITEKIKAKKFCNKILDNNVTHQYIEENIGCLTDVMHKIMPKDYEHSNLLMEYSILVDDILEMQSTSQYANALQEVLDTKNLNDNICVSTISCQMKILVK